MPRLDELVAGRWNELLPGGDTSCSRGTPYAFWVHPGASNRLLIDLHGGGACWDAETCAIGSTLFNQDVENVRNNVRNGLPVGIYDRNDDRNPFRDWTHVMIPMCTGDLHWGNARVSYGEGPDAFEVEHRGAVNARAVIDWIFDNVASVEEIFIGGCSAGSYGSIMWAAQVMQHYPDARITQFGDCGAGIGPASFFVSENFANWNPSEVLPSFISALDPARVDYRTLDLTDVYTGIGNYFPAQRFSQYNTAFDATQVIYYQAMGGGTAEEWSAQMFAAIADIEASTPNFGSFIASGENHCVWTRSNFYTVNIGGRLLVDFLRDMMDRQPVERLKCADCAAPTP